MLTGILIFLALVFIVPELVICAALVIALPFILVINALKEKK